MRDTTPQLTAATPETDQYGNHRDEAGRLIVAEQPRNDGRKLKYRLSPAQAREVAQEYSDGQHYVRTIAEMFGISPTLVKRMAQVHGVPPRHPAQVEARTRTDVERAKRLRLAGFSVREIAREMEISFGTAAAIFARFPKTQLTHEEAKARQQAKRTAE